MRNTNAHANTGLLDELERALTHGTVARRVETLRAVTDLFLSNETIDYSDEHLALFDDVFDCLVRRIETSAMIALAERLGPAMVAPPRIIRRLARHEAADIAAPVLSQSRHLDDDTLLDAARSRGQAHLLAISKRKTLSGALTEVLIERGDDNVVHSTVSNPGADFTDGSYDTLLKRAECDDDLATCIGLRPTLPRHLYLKLVAKASASVRARLTAANPAYAAEVSSAVTDAMRRARNAPEGLGRETVIAHSLVKLLHDDGRLDERQLRAFSDAGKFDETNATLACLAHVPVETAETLMLDMQSEGVLILSKVSHLSWAAARSIIAMRDEMFGSQTPDLDALQATYERLRPSTAQQVLRFHRMQATSASIPAPAA